MLVSAAEMLSETPGELGMIREASALCSCSSPQKDGLQKRVAEGFVCYISAWFMTSAFILSTA